MADPGAGKQMLFAVFRCLKELSINGLGHNKFGGGKARGGLFSFEMENRKLKALNALNELESQDFRN